MVPNGGSNFIFIDYTIYKFVKFTAVPPGVAKAYTPVGTYASRCVLVGCAYARGAVV